MREYSKKPENQSRRLDSNPKASKQAPIDVILQRHKESIPRDEKPNNTGLPASAGPLSSKVSASGDTTVQRIRIKLDDGLDPIMNNVRASPVPQPGETMVDGFRNYDPGHRPIGMNENIILEGHGTYLDPHHDVDANYDSQAYLTPRQLANVAFLVPKPDNWAGQIILFGCNTGPLTMEVSRHYLALARTPVNVVGTLADIRMEVPGSHHPNGHRRPVHTAEYDADRHGRYPTAPAGNISAGGRVRHWSTEGVEIGQAIRDEMELFYSIQDEELANDVGRNRLREAVDPSIESITRLLTASLDLNYQGLKYDGTEIGLNQIGLIREMMMTAVSDLLLLKEMFGFDEISLYKLQDKALGFVTFFDQLISELRALRQITISAAESYPPGTVDWEGENVVNSRAVSALGLYGIPPLDRAEIGSDRWGGGGGLMMEMMQQETIRNDEDFL